jgi:methionyl-tRNA synthetase
MKRAFISTSIPYVNAKPHIGHALELVQTDTLARAYRFNDYDVYALTGTDENAQKNVESAEKIGVTVQALVDENSKNFEKLKIPLNLNFDGFIRTTAEKHFLGAQKLWRLCEKDIYKKTYVGLYCVGCEAFYKDGEFENNVCPDHKRKLDLVSEENYFFALSKYQYKLAEIIESDTVAIHPNFRKQEVLNFINKGLEDFSVSRPAERMKGWGVPVPNDDAQRMYVWFDALSNYITALDFNNNGELFEKFWINNPKRIHVIGKDIVKFHAIYWIAMLISAKQMLPTEEYVHGFISVDGQKISKSLGNVIDPYELCQEFGTDAVRYFLLREIPSLTDGDFSYERMKQLYNSDLANELGNLISRLTNLGATDEIFLDDIDETPIQESIESALQFDFNKGLQIIWLKVKKLNKEMNEQEPWKKEADKRREFLINSLKDLRRVGVSLSIYMPSTSDRIIQATTGKIIKSSPLFPKLT